MNRQAILTRGLAVLAALAALTSAYGQWTVTNLHPSGATGSDVLGAQAGGLVGNSETAGVPFAGIWANPSSTIAAFLVGGESSSNATGIDGDTVSGYAAIGAVNAGFWHRVTGVWTNLHPGSASASKAYAVSGNQVVGSADFASRSALVWNTTTFLWDDLNPAGSTWSEALAVNGGYQAGYGTFGGNEEAGFWNGTSASWVNLAPGAFSRAMGIQAPTVPYPSGRQVGYAVTDTLRATMWLGSASGAVDLHPTSTSEFSAATAIDQDHQVGWVTSGGFQHATIWKNTAASAIDLHALLPVTFSDSVANAVYHTPTATIVVGSGTNAGRKEALVWTGPPLVTPFTWTGYLQPINPNGTSIFKLGRTIPVKFRLTGEFADKTDLVAHLYVARVTNGEVGTEVEPDQGCDEDEGAVFRYRDGTYGYNLGTRWMTKGTYQLRVDMGDGVDDRTVLITLRK